MSTTHWYPCIVEWSKVCVEVSRISRQHIGALCDWVDAGAVDALDRRVGFLERVRESLTTPERSEAWFSLIFDRSLLPIGIRTEFLARTLKFPIWRTGTRLASRRMENGVSKCLILDSRLLKLLLRSNHFDHPLVVGAMALKLANWLLAAVLASGCAKVLPVYQIPEITVGEPGFFPTIEAYTDAPIVGGNRVEILLNGDQTFPVMLRDIRARDPPSPLPSISTKPVPYPTILRRLLPNAVGRASRFIF